MDYLKDSTLLEDITPKSLNYNFGLIDQRFGFGKHCVHHTRKYFISSLINKGASLPLVAKLVGHSTKSITIDVYTTPDLEELRHIISLLS